MNILLANTPKGTIWSAVIFNMIQTALENGFWSYRYLTRLMKAAYRTDLTFKDELQVLPPWNASAECQAK